MTKRKRRKLEEQRLLEKASRQENDGLRQMTYNGIQLPNGMQVQGCAVPLKDGKGYAIQLPPIIQPVAMVPWASVEQPVEAEDDEDEFDDFEDWC